MELVDRVYLDYSNGEGIESEIYQHQPVLLVEDLAEMLEYFLYIKPWGRTPLCEL